MTKQTFRVTGMECSACNMRLENIEDELPGIQRIQASYRKARMQVEYDETQISEAQIIAAVKSKGYEAIPIG